MNSFDVFVIKGFTVWKLKLLLNNGKGLIWLDNVAFVQNKYCIFGIIENREKIVFFLQEIGCGSTLDPTLPQDSSPPGG